MEAQLSVYFSIYKYIWPNALKYKVIRSISPATEQVETRVVGPSGIFCHWIIPHHEVFFQGKVGTGDNWQYPIAAKIIELDNFLSSNFYYFSHVCLQM